MRTLHVQNKLDHARDMLEEKHTKMDYHRDRIQAIDKKLKALPDFESSSGTTCRHTYHWDMTHS